MVHWCLVQNNEIGFLHMLSERERRSRPCLEPSPNNKVAIGMVSAKFGKNNAASGGGSSTDISLAEINGWIFQNAIDMSVDDPFSVDNVVLSCF